MGNYRVYVEKKKEYQVDEKSLLNDLKSNLNLAYLSNVRMINIYDVFYIEEDLLEVAKKNIFSEVVMDEVYETVNLKDCHYFAMEYLPGQFDQRADSAEQCIRLISPTSQAKVRSGKIIILEGEISDQDLLKVKKYCINEVESRIKNLNVLSWNEEIVIKPVQTLFGFIERDVEQLKSLKDSLHLAMNFEDFLFIQNYFKNNERRDPTETEIFMLDTYWSDHCRHTTFETLLKDITFNYDRFQEEIQRTYQRYLKLREVVHGGEKPITLMDMATIGGKYERKIGNLNDLEISKEINACSIYVDVDVDGCKEKYLLMFKNETHNHPTEIEPFGGASTCIGGAIRDPLSGRSYVYQAMRVTGAGNILEPMENTLNGKLPQRIISKQAASGYSSYGNQIGLATSHVREIFHEGYKAKRMEVGAVVGIAPLSHVRREEPLPGDVVIMFGGRTGRDGIGGATGSSKEHNEVSLETSSAEVQKGNAPEERKIQRLFRRQEVTRLVKRSNDFGAGGVSVAIGEIADSVDIDLDQVKTKYKGLNGSEIAISESQERMAVVVEEKDSLQFIRYCQEENIEAVIVAKVTDSGRLRMYWQGNKIVDLNRDFINSSGVRQEVDVKINEIEDLQPFERVIEGASLKEKIINNLKDMNVANQKGMIEMFDSSIGSTTVLMPFGGKYQLTPTQSSVHKIPLLKGNTTSVSMMSFGFNPFISTWSPYHGAAYAVLESISKIVANGGNYKNIRFSFQEYFEKLNKDPSRWGKPFSALLGTIYMQSGLHLPSIGGKDSMSGTFKEVHVPPSLLSFAVAMGNTKEIISNEFKQSNHFIYLIKHQPTSTLMPNLEVIKNNYDFIYSQIISKNIVAAYALETGGLSAGLVRMAIGNKIGFDVQTNLDLFSYNYGSILVESAIELNFPTAIYLGKTTLQEVKINSEIFEMNELIEAISSTFEKIYPTAVDLEKKRLLKRDFKIYKTFEKKQFNEVSVLIPVFPGTNCDYDTAKAFEKAGGKPQLLVFTNQSESDIKNSLENLIYAINQSQIIALSGGFSAGDEPDGSGKFIANVLNQEEVKDAIHQFLDRGGLMLGICNGFQALVKSGLLPYGRLGSVKDSSPTLMKNNINRHVSKIIQTRVVSNNSPWLSSFKIGEVYSIPLSHGEGKFVVSESDASELFDCGQVAFQYCDFDGNPTMDGRFNPNGSYFAIEGIVSKCGQILGKMGHSERISEDVYKNIEGNKFQNIFENAVRYFKKENQ